jgi:hypothetical protein
MNSQSAQEPASQSDAIAAQMVPARAYLKNKLDAKHAQPGTTFTANLSESVQLKNGPKLPRGTQLTGAVTANDTQTDGTSRLALTIAEAHLKNGETIPVKATIVGVWGPEDETAQGYNVAPGEQEANDWTESFLTIDEVNATPGTDLHSEIASQNSGVFVTKKKNSDVKLAAGSELAVAIAKQDNVQQPAAESGN